ncbi:MAG: FKBP-type peptidyl-prolyl cis-trans isomerase [Bacteroidales bacterium]|nr:FKBP-type peptidyl-prolyl cis-trans isomerase [Bacteroidales bacterium]MBN2697876.1 FKBP-type peptidyl-prolyl cis-trans isomerase [Bacteroidales bacterium]
MKVYEYISIIGLVLAFGMLFHSCEKDEGQSKAENEKRYFDLYITSHYPGLSPTESGLYIKLIEEGSGPVPDSGDWVLINYVISSIPSDKTTGAVLDTYYEKVAIEHGLYEKDVLYGSYKFMHGQELRGLKEGLSTMKEGGKTRLMFTSDLGFGSKGTSLVNPYTSLIYDVHLMKVLGDIDTYESSRINEYLDTVPDSKITGKFDEEIGATLYYIEDKEGSGFEIANDTVVRVIYTGYLMDQRVFDTNVGGDTLEVTIGKGKVISGWELGLTCFKRGGKGRLIIPYPLGYGEAGKLNYNGKVSIPPCETLVFDMEVVNDQADQD